MQESFSIHISCPWCHYGEIMADDRAKLRVSVMCPVCLKMFVADLHDMRGYRPKEEPINKKRNMTEKYSCPCPICRGETRADGKGNVRISVKCPKKHKDHSSRYYTVDLMTGESGFCDPVRKRGRK